MKTITFTMDDEYKGLYHIGHDCFDEDHSGEYVKADELKKAHDAIRSALKISNLWFPRNPQSIENIEELRALSFMHDRFLDIISEGD